jgi:lysophospholipase L1-like esterase
MKTRRKQTVQPVVSVAAAVLMGAMPLAHGQQATPWTVTWARAQVMETVGADGADPNFTLSNQTLRQIVHTSIAGSTARIRLSNLYGTVPLTIDDVHLALSANNQAPATVAGTAVTVTFGGQSSVTIPVGGSITSDTVSFPVPALSDVAVSMYFPGPTPIVNLTAHDFSFEGNYYVAGDQSGAQTFNQLGQENRYVFLEGLDVQQPAAAGTIVAFGASISDGFNSNFFANHRWPDVLAQRLTAAGLTWGIDDEGIPGDGTTGPPGQFGPGATERYSQDALTQPNVRWIFYSDFVINDVSSNSATPVATEISALQSAITQAHAAGLSLVCSTLTPFGGPDNTPPSNPNGRWTQAGEDTREAYNTFVQTPGNGCDAVFDQAAAIQDPTCPIQNPQSCPVQIAPPWNSGDGVHPSDIGYQILGNAINLSLFGQLPAGTPLIPDGTYSLVVRNSGEGTTPLVLDDPGQSTASGTVMDVWTLNEGDNQHWKLSNLGNNIVSLTNVLSNLVLEAAGGSTAAGAGVDQAPSTGATSQQWQLVSAGDGWFEVINVASGDSLDVTGGSTTPGTSVVQWPYHDAIWEQWTFVH